LFSKKTVWRSRRVCSVCGVCSVSVCSALCLCSALCVSALCGVCSVWCLLCVVSALCGCRSVVLRLLSPPEVQKKCPKASRRFWPISGRLGQLARCLRPSSLFCYTRRCCFARTSLYYAKASNSPTSWTTQNLSFCRKQQAFCKLLYVKAWHDVMVNVLASAGTLSDTL
jgi:hypothetical protein